MSAYPCAVIPGFGFRLLHMRFAEPLLLLASVAAAYFTAFDGAFQFDDYAVIVNNPAVHGWAAWFASMPGIRPLLKLSYTANWASGLGLTGFHLFNLACHAANALMALALFRRWPGAAKSGAAFVAALIFALHPAHTEAVTYISGRSVSLMAMFYLAAFLAWLHAQETGREFWRTVAAPVLFIAALATKETAWTLPFALLLWEYARTGDWRDAAKRLMPLWILLAAALAFMAGLPGYRRLVMFSLESRPPFDNLLTQITGQFYLLRQLLLPLPNIDPDFPSVTGLNMVIAAKVLLLVGLAIWAAFSLRRRPLLGLALLWFFLHLLPTNSFLPRLDVANDRQLYLASLGPALAIAVALSRIPLRQLSNALVLILVLTLGTATAWRNLDYRSERALWQATVQDSPQKARAWLNLGYAYRLSGDTLAARTAYEHALELEPDYLQARINLHVLSEMPEK
jgi:tetratricopeptide (TPR) repeat protein